MKKHPRYTESERQSHLLQLNSSKLGLVAYSNSSGVSLSCLRYWLYSRYKSKAPSKDPDPSFLPINIIEDLPSALEVIIEFPKGIRVSIVGAVSAGYIKSLL